MMKMNTIEGRMSMKPPANRYGSGDSLSDANTCAGRVRFWTVRILAANTSFHDNTKVKMLAAAMPGMASGSTTRKNAVIGVQPSVHAASSRSYGTARKMLLEINIVVGRASVVWTRATANTVSYRFQLMNVTASGTARMAIGNAREIRIAILNASRPLKTKRARP